MPAEAREVATEMCYVASATLARLVSAPLPHAV